MVEELIGTVSHFFGKINVAAIKLSGTLKKGDRIKISGPDIEFEQDVDSMQIDRVDVEEAQAGQEIGMLVSQPAKEGCQVFKVTEEA